MRVRVDFELCESTGNCVEILPAVFELRDDDYLYLLTEEITPEQEDRARTAVIRCPRQAITLD